MDADPSPRFQKCWNCLYFLSYNANADEDTGFCTINPPGNGQYGYATWPQVWRGRWCGKWSPPDTMTIKDAVNLLKEWEKTHEL
jgi:hypothetical protein